MSGELKALDAYRIAYKTILGMSPYHLVYGKACHLPVAVEYKNGFEHNRHEEVLRP